MTNVARAAELVARESYGKLIAILAKRTGDIAAAEDALADAFSSALKSWPETGVPDNPQAWLLTTARNRLTDKQRQEIRFPKTSEVPDIAAPSDTYDSDERLALLFVCAHPAIAPTLHTPLMLQCVLGIEAVDIARVFLISPTAVAQRLVRAKRKIKEANIPFSIPDTAAHPERMDAVYEAIYAVHALDWLDPSDSMGDEALYLADLLAKLRPQDPEALGLAALIAFGHARRNARLVGGTFIPLQEQDMSLWDNKLNNYGLNVLNKAQRLGKVGRFQIEAAIQSVHVHRQETGTTNWAALEKLYHALMKMFPTVGGAIAQAAVIGELHGPSTGLGALDRLDLTIIKTSQPAWVTRAELLLKLDRKDEAHEAFNKALSLTTDPILRRYLEGRILLAIH